MLKGFSKLTKAAKRDMLQNFGISAEELEILKKMEAGNPDFQNILENLSENVISAYSLPYAVAPNFLIDKREFIIPMVTEESSVVAAAAKSAGFWYTRGGFHTEITGTIKHGHVHFKYKGNKDILIAKFRMWNSEFYISVEAIDHNMKERGGGIQSIELIDKTSEPVGYYQIEVAFDTQNAMGANYINSCLETIAATFVALIDADDEFAGNKPEIIMSILSNYSPQNAVKVYVECTIDELAEPSDNLNSGIFAQRFCDAVEIAGADVSRAVTHNKGFYNGIDAVALATGNDWRAIEANGHAYAAASGKYKGISKAFIQDNVFRFEATVPLQVGTTGGIIKIHPLAGFSMLLLQNPSATDLMRIMASAGLASNFAAVKSLVTTGIQKGHMKMHLSNILIQLNANEEEGAQAKKYFENRTVSHSEVVKFIAGLRQKP